MHGRRWLETRLAVQLGLLAGSEAMHVFSLLLSIFNKPKPFVGFIARGLRPNVSM